MQSISQRIRVFIVLISLIAGIWPVSLPTQAAPQVPEKRPVILVPGMGASWNANCILFGLGCEDESAWGFFPIRAREVYQPLIDHLAAAGYNEENHYLKIVYYNWTQPLESNLQRLMEKIDEVKGYTGAAQVDLVGHSMGGLLVRAYVQSKAYPTRDDAAHLITLGSPHKGVSKAYPFWEAAYLYDVLPEEYNQLLILLNYIAQVFPLRVYGLRLMIPSFQDLLPTADYLDVGQSVPAYLYNHRDDDELIPEAGMRQRNAYLTELNMRMGELFERTQAYAFYGDELNTPARFYVRSRYFWEWPNWDDGLPIWSRLAEFESLAGDGTVMASSAALTCPGASGACLREFPGVDHSALIGNTEALSEMFAILGIPLLPLGEAKSLPESPDTLLVLSLYGDAEFTLTDSAGRSLNAVSSEIPDAQYASAAGQPYQVVLIPRPADGQFQVQVQGKQDGQYRLSLLDNFTSPATVITNTEVLWDSAPSTILAGATVDFTFTYDEAGTEIALLQALTPIIHTPVLAGKLHVEGRAPANSMVEIRQTGSDTLLGSANAGADGTYLITLRQPLPLGQEIYAWSTSGSSLPVTVTGYVRFIPLAEK